MKQTVVKIPIPKTVQAAASAVSELQKKHEPIVIRRTYDITTSCGRKQKHGHTAGNPPIEMHIQGETESSLLRCALIGTAVVCTIAAVGMLCRLHCAAKYRRKYAKRYAEKQKREQYRYQKKIVNRKNTDKASAAHKDAASSSGIL